MHESETNRLRKRQRALGLAVMDMRQAFAAAKALEREADDVDLMLALETAIVVTYARAFTKSTLLTLDSSEYRPDNRGLGWFHDELLKLRSQKYAHTDKDSGRTAEIRFVVARA